MKIGVFCVLLIGLFSCSSNNEIDVTASKNELLFSSIKGEQSRTEVLTFSIKGDEFDSGNFKLNGVDADLFQFKVDGNTLEILFQPGEEFVGLANAELNYFVDGTSKLMVPLRGLSTKALEGENEPSLAMVLDILGYKINLGWNTLANHVLPDLQGEELTQTWFTQVGENPVEMIPVARYSPPFLVGFGLTVMEKNNFRIGTLADSEDYPEHQTIFPSIFDGSNSIDFDEGAFCFYTESPTHFAYSVDSLNDAEHAKHAVRIYQAKDRNGQKLDNEFLVCFEEALNGDYQDYVFLVRNVKTIVQ